MKALMLSISIFLSLNVFSNTYLGNDNGDVTLSVFPNPATEYINVTVKGGVNDAVVKIYSALGTEIYSENIDNFKKIDVSDFKNNVYIINVYSKDELIETARFVVRH
jgi:hypothetical protein